MRKSERSAKKLIFKMRRAYGASKSLATTEQLHTTLVATNN